MIERDSTATAGNNTPIIIAVIVIAVVVIGLFVWQPWNQRSATAVGTIAEMTTTVISSENCV